jgi:uncharacterized protein (UPF0335 family)
MSDSVAQDQIKAFVDRIIRLREEAAGLKADIREVYAEAKGNGLDKTILGKVVSHVEKMAADANGVMETEALFELYIVAYQAASGTRLATHMHEREAA